jgi:tyrosine decarboxylase/aspartate 1-decarboxylase
LEKNIGDTGFSQVQNASKKRLYPKLHLFFRVLKHGVRSSQAERGKFFSPSRSKKPCRKNKREVVLPESAHYSFDKAAAFMDLSLRKIPLTDSFTADVNSLKDAVNDRTMAIIAVAGSTGLGAVDPIPQIAEIAQRIPYTSMWMLPLGALFFPSSRALVMQGIPSIFRSRGVSSITIDPHKMGRAPVPAGCILFRDERTARLAETL